MFFATWGSSHFHVFERVVCLIGRLSHRRISEYSFAKADRDAQWRWAKVVDSRVGSSIKNRLNKIVNIATKLINLKQKSLNDLYQQAISKKKSRSIINDPTHPLHSYYEIMPSSKRYRTPAFKRQLYNKSFIPSAVRFLNSQKNVSCHKSLSSIYYLIITFKLFLQN